MRSIAFHLALLTLLAPVARAQTCFPIRGRAVLYRGDAFFEIWHVGTHHIFYPANNESTDLICRYFDCKSGDRQPAMYADFTICPTEPQTAGAAQGAIVKAIQHPRVVTDWPAPKSALEYVKSFYDWYAPKAQVDSGSDWVQLLKLAHWDLSPELARLLDDDANAQADCKEIVGLDFDPFLNTKEPAEHYDFGPVEKVGPRYETNVYRVTESRQAEKPDVIAVVARDGDRWYFDNFLYPVQKTDLLTILGTPRPKCMAPRDSVKNYPARYDD